jgi:hypothetical protein
MTIISLERIWLGSGGVFLAIIMAWACGLVDDHLFAHRFMVLLPAAALTVDSWLRRAFPGLYGGSPFAEFED